MCQGRNFGCIRYRTAAVEDISSDISDTSEKSFTVIRREDLDCYLVWRKQTVGTFAVGRRMREGGQSNG